MNIVVFSMTPLFPKMVMGGSQRVLKDIVEYLGKLDHPVKVFCTRRWDSKRPFKWKNNVEVLPILCFKQPYPNPYATQPYNIANAVSLIGAELKKADRFYIHDGAFIFPYVYCYVPTVASLRDFVYSETIQGAFHLGADKLILPSQYAADLWINTTGRFFPELKTRIKVIHNGFDWNCFKNTDTKRIRKFLKIKTKGKKTILYPHRPEKEKGIFETISLLKQLVFRYGLKNVVVLAPKWIETNNNQELADYYKKINLYVKKLGLENNFYLHEWVPYELMPEYFSLGDLTACLGNYLETFGNIPYESLGCGTPVIISKIGPGKSLLKDFAEIVDYQDINHASNIAFKLLTKRRTLSLTKIKQLRNLFPLERMVKGFAEEILKTEKTKKLIYKTENLNSCKNFKIAPWCSLQQNKFYNELSGNFIKENGFILKKLIRTYSYNKFNYKIAKNISRKINLQALRKEIIEGNIIPC